MTDTAATVIVALYDNLPEATAALYDLQTVGVPYTNIRLATHSNADVDPAMIAAPLPADGRFWSLAVTFAPDKRAAAFDALREHAPFVLGFQRAAEHGRDEVDQGRIAWGHYVFESPAATDQASDAAGTTGTTGVSSSGAFATTAQTERPPATTD